MTEQEMRIEIAKACGWRNIRPLGDPLRNRWTCFTDDQNGYPPENFTEETLVGLHPENSDRALLSAVPDYTTDLNAMNEVEKMLTEEQYTSYSLAAFEDTSFTGWLFRIMVRCREEPDYRTHSASAYERAEAFLRTIGVLIDPYLAK